MLDSLIQFLVEELAMHGEYGASPSSLTSLINAHFSTHATAQSTDERFLSFVWETLLGIEDIRAGVLVVSETDTPEERAAGDFEPTGKSKGKGKAKASAGPLSLLRPLDKEERGLGWVDLVSRFGEDLRVAVSEEESWVALTGSHARPSSLTPPVYSVLQLVGRSRTEGVLMTDISKTFDFDPKSCFHFVRALVEIGVVKKFRAANPQNGLWTNRILHVRYLDQSSHWAIHTARDPPSNPLPESDDDQKTTHMSVISRSYLSSNRSLVKSRILRVVRNAGDGGMLHSDISTAIGLLGRQRKDLRRLTAIISGLADDGIIEKYLRTVSNKGSQVLMVRASAKAAVPVADEHSTSVNHIEDEPEEDGPRALSALPLDRQALDLLMEADADGMRNTDISAALSSFSPRYVDMIFQRLAKTPPPAHLVDHTIQALLENVGREKRTRWFTQNGYLRRCERDGADLPEGTPADDIVGGWNRDEDAAPTYYDEDAFVVWQAQAPLYKNTAGAKGGSEKVKYKSRTLKARNPKPDRMGPVGRPRKHPRPPNGKLTYYERRKLEDAERAAQGLPPRPKRIGGGGRKSRAELVNASGEDVDQLLSPLLPASDHSQTPAGPSPKMRGRPPKAKPVDEQLTPVDVDTPTPALEERKVLPRKRGRPPTSKPGDDDARPPKRGRGSAATLASPSASAPAPPTPSLPPAAAPASIPGARRDHSIAPAKAKASFFIGPFPTKLNLVPHAPANAAGATPSTLVRAPTPVPAALTSGGDQPLAPASMLTPPPPPSPASALAPYARRKVRKVPPKANLTHLQRQNDILAYIQQRGGVVELNGSRTAEEIKDFLEKRTPGESTYVMDRSVLQQAVSALVDRGLLKRTVIQTGTLARRRNELLYLPTIALDNPEALALQLNLNKETAKPFRRSLGNTVFEPVEPKDSPLPQSGDRAVLREYFRRHSKIAGAAHGLLYGRFARARVMHLAVREILTSPPASANFFIVTPNTFSAELLVYSLPLGILLKVSPIPVLPELQTYIADESHLALPLQEVPSWVRDAVIGVPRSRRNLNNVMHTLDTLHLVTPLVTTTDGVTFERARIQARPSHFRLESTAPVYDFHLATPRLLAVVPVDTVEDSQAFWEALHLASFPSSHPPTFNRHAAPDGRVFPAIFDGPKTLRKTITSKTKWKDDYMLLEPQRKYLRDLDLDLETATPEELAQVADDILAPVSAVEAFVTDYHQREARRQEVKRQKLEDGESDDVDQPAQDQPPKDLARSLRRKENEAFAQRESDFAALLDRFSREHGNIELSGPVFDYVKRRFCSKSAVGRFDAATLRKELLLLLPGAGPMLDDGYKSVVPSAIRYKAEEGADPYALPLAPRLKHRRPNKPKPTRAPTPVGQSADVGEFLSAGVRPVPRLQKGQRLPRNFFTPEQDELSLDAVAVIKARAEHLGQRLSFAALGTLFEGIPVPRLRQHFVRLVTKPEDAFYHQRLQAAWTAVWEQRRDTGELPDPQPTSLTSFDISACVRCLRANVDKKALRLVGPPAPNGLDGHAAASAGHEIAADPLPSSLVELERTYQVDPPGIMTSPDRWAWFWKAGAANALRETDSAWLPGSVPCHSFQSNLATWDRETSLVIATLKTLCATPESAYSETEASSILHPFEEKLPQAIKILLDSGVFTKNSSEGRRTPGRNFALSDKYLSSFDDVLTTRRSRDAVKLEQSLQESQAVVEVWPVVTEVGDMMSLIKLVSNGHVDLTIDTTVSSEFRDPEDYQTRKADDECIENAVHIKLLCALETHQPTPSPAPMPPLGTTDDVAHLTETLKLAQERSEGSNLVQIMDVLVEAGKSGLTFHSLSKSVPGLSSTILRAHVHTLTTSTPPLAFWAGEAVPVVVASHHIQGWTIRTPDLSPHGSMVMFPVLWRDLRGGLIPSLWVKAVAWLKSFLSTRPGSTCLEITFHAKLSLGGLLLSCLEVMLLLATLERAHVLDRRGRDEDYIGENWEEDRYFLSPTLAWYQL